MSDLSRGCEVGECGRKHEARGLCKVHYNAAVRRRAFTPRAGLAVADRFWQKVQIPVLPQGEFLPDDCWLWGGAKNEKGYGFFWIDGRLARATRIAWAFAHPDDMPSRGEILHECDNPPCVNFAHLRDGTRSENMRDMIAKGRAAWQRGAVAS